MPKLVIDNLPIEVPEGLKVIEAAERLGIMIPRFCFFKELGAVGACRVCAVKFEDGPVKGIRMSCMIDAQDGMVVSTTDPEAVDFRRHVIEWLMLHHPHDCPVCDEGGHCLLQDMTQSSGHGIRRYKGKKRTYIDQYLGPLIYHELNRCIQCYRCSRFYQEYAGYADLGVMGIAGRVYFGRFRDGVLDSPFSGNIIDLCPTGVYTDKPSRYTGRRWDYERTPGVCIHCSLGCNTKVSARYREIVYIKGRLSEPVNGWFLCDRGRYGFYYANLERRPRRGRINGGEATSHAAVDAAARRLSEITRTHGASAVAVIGSGRSSLETQAAVVRLCRDQGWRPPVFWNGKRTAQSVNAAISSFSPGLAVSMREIESADVVLVIGADPINEAPMLALAMRQAWRKGAEVFAADCRHLEWPFPFVPAVLRPDQLPGFLDALQGGLADEADNAPETSDPIARAIAKIAGRLREARRPVVVCGTGVTHAETVFRAAGLSSALRDTGKSAGLFFILPQANSYGAMLLDDGGETAEELIGRINSGQVKGLVAIESDILEEFAGRRRLADALDRLDLLVSADYLDTELHRRAHIAIPTLTQFESGGIYINQEGRAQWSAPAYAGGIPVRIEGGGGHPPRDYYPHVPGGDIMPGWRIAGWLTGDPPPPTREKMVDWIIENIPGMERLGEIPEEGIRLFLPDDRRGAAKRGGNHPETDGKLEFLPTAATFGDEIMARFSPCLESYAKSPELWMADTEAASFDAADGDSVTLALGEEPVELTVRVSERMAPGVMIVYRYPGLFWQQFGDTPRFYLDRNRVRIKRNL